MTVRASTYEFDDLPLIVVNGGYRAGGSEDAGIAGCAEILYDEDGSWSLGEIAIEVRRPKTAAERAGHTSIAHHKLEPHWLDKSDPLRAIIAQRLENEWRAKVQDEVDEQIFNDLSAENDNLADYRRDARRAV